MRNAPVILMVFLLFGLAAMSFQKQVIEFSNKKPPEVALLSGWINSYYAGDAEKFWEIVSKFDNPQFESLQEVQQMMADRNGERQIAVEIDKMPYFGVARTLSQRVDDIEYRIDEMGENGAMYVFTAWVTRVIDFAYDEGRAQVERKAALKVYVTMKDGKFTTYYSDETEMEKSFAHLHPGDLKKSAKSGEDEAGVVQAAHVH